MGREASVSKHVVGGLLVILEDGSSTRLKQRFLNKLENLLSEKGWLHTQPYVMFTRKDLETPEAIFEVRTLHRKIDTYITGSYAWRITKDLGITPTGVIGGEIEVPRHKAWLYDLMNGRWTGRNPALGIKNTRLPPI